MEDLATSDGGKGVAVKGVKDVKGVRGGGKGSREGKM